jgi:hypothetical protein
MTLLLKIAVTPEVVVLSGDKRLVNGNDFEDTATKATRLGKLAVGGASGATRSLHPETKIVQRDTHEQLRTFFHDREVDTDSLKDFFQHLRDQYEGYIKNHRGGEPHNPGQLFSIVIASLQQGRIIDYTIEASVSPKGGLTLGLKTYLCKTGALMSSGDWQITKALQLLEHPALSEIKGHADIVRLLLNKDCPFGVVTLERAIEICRLINGVCSKGAKEILGKTSTISPNCDVLVLDKTGVRPA